MSLSKIASCSRTGEEYDFLFRRPSDIRAGQFKASILAIAGSKTEEELKTAVCAGIHACFKNVLKSNAFMFLHDDGLKYKTKEGTLQELAQTGILWKVVRARANEVFTSVPPNDPFFKLMEVEPEDIEDRVVLIDPVSNVTKMRTVALLIAICNQPTTEEKNNYNWLAKNVEVAAVRVLERIKSEGEKTRMEEILKLSGSLIDLDVPMLLLKLHSHIKQIIQCKTCVVFVLDEESDELVCEVFDDTALDGEKRLAIPECIYGKCILSDEIIKIDDVPKDPRVNPNTDFICNYEPTNMLCIPLKSRRTSAGTVSVVGVAVLYDKIGGSFTIKDQEDLLYILKFCSTMLVNTLTFRHEIVLKHQNQTLLNVSKNLFSRLNDRDVLLHSIMEEARNLTKAERCSLFLVEENELVAVVFDSELPEEATPGSSVQIRIPIGQGIAGFVAQSGKSVNIRDAYKSQYFYKEVDKTTGFVTRNVLCIPIIDHTGVVGVTQLVNKKGGRFFTSYDEELAKSFSVYCGISLHHAMLYKNVTMEQSRSQLATELMLYHMQVQEDELSALSKKEIPSCKSFSPAIVDITFSPRVIPDNDSAMCIISMMEDMKLLSRWSIPRNNLARFVMMVKKGYRNPPYHNWMHAFSVTHFCYTLFKNCPQLEKMLTDLEILALFISCMCHDIDHRGTNNAFQETSNTVLASLYSSEGSVMERHHFSQTMCILNSKGCKIFKNLTSEEYREILDLIYDIILATDIATHLSIVPDLEKMAKAQSAYNTSNKHHHHLLRSLLMTACDLCDCLKEWDMAVSVSKLIYDEFFSQGDIEKSIGKTPSVMMDRDRAVLSEQQVTFLDKIAMPVYKILSQLVPGANKAYESVLSNREKWEKFQ